MRFSKLILACPSKLPSKNLLAITVYDPASSSFANDAIAVIFVLSNSRYADLTLYFFCSAENKSISTFISLMLILFFLYKNSGLFNFTTTLKESTPKEILVLSKFIWLLGILDSTCALIILFNDEVSNPFIKNNKQIKSKTKTRDRNFIIFIIYANL